MIESSSTQIMYMGNHVKKVQDFRISHKCVKDVTLFKSCVRLVEL